MSGPAAAGPSRNIIVLSDGTGNSSAKLFRTNVWKLYRALDLADCDENKVPRQFAHYDDGVGSSSFKPYAILGGALGVGLARNVRDLYAFICRTWRPGDRIYLFGFSRGAFTVRILSGLIRWQGIQIYDGNEAKLQKDVSSAYRAYRRRRYTRLTLRTMVTRMRDRRSGPRLGPELPHERGGKADDPVKIAFIGVWDTVAAYGLPFAELTRAIDRFIVPLQMPDRDLSDKVERAMQALAIDEERNTFFPVVWNEGPPKGKTGAPPNTPHQPERLTQVWFAGVHSDVGGGYSDDSASYVPLEWMMKGANAAGLRFIPRVWADYRAQSDANGPLHDSRKGVAGYYRYMPRRMELLTENDEVTVDRVKVHKSAFMRISDGGDGYAPLVLPKNFDVVDDKGTVTEKFCAGQIKLTTASGVTVSFENLREHLFDFVWLRRVVYFSTLAVTLALASAPLWWTGATATPTPWCSRIVAKAFTVVGGFLPGFASTWLDAFRLNPLTAAALIVVALSGLAAGGRIETTLRDAMRRIWYALPEMKPHPSTLYKKPDAAGHAARALQFVRRSGLYKSCFDLFRKRIAPGFVFGLVALVGLMLFAKAVYTAATAMGLACYGAAAPPLIQYGKTAPVFFMEAKEPCNRSGLKLEEGGTYRLTFYVPPDDPWLDDHLRAGPEGVDSTVLPPWMAAFAPIRRQWEETWFKPIARVGPKGLDYYPLKAIPTAANGKIVFSSDAASECRGRELAPKFDADVVARKTGELFVYVNDAIVLPGVAGWFYDNNHGSACVTVERLPLPTDR